MYAYMTLNVYVMAIVLSTKSYIHKHVIWMWSWIVGSVVTCFGVLNEQWVVIGIAPGGTMVAAKQ